MIEGLFNTDAMPVLERMVQFAGRRQELISHNIANLSTPNFQPVDVSVADFQRALGDAIEERRKRTGVNGALPVKSTREVEFVSASGAGGDSLRLKPRTTSSGVLAHDRNNRDLERTMQDLAENAAAFRVASEFLRSRFALLDSAIRLRP